MASLVVTIKGTNVAELKQASSAPHESVAGLINHLQSLSSGNEAGTVYVQSGSDDPVAASATLTLVSAIATDAITIGPVTFTATSTPTLSTDWEIDGASDTFDAASLAAAINAHATVSQIVTASANSNVVTVSAKQKGVVGNYIAISSADATITATGSGYLASGAGGATNAPSTHAYGQ